MTGAFLIMKKIIIFLTVLFVFTLTSISQSFVNGTYFRLTMGGNEGMTDFSVSYNPDSHYILIVWNYPLINLSITPTEGILHPDMQHTYIDPLNMEGIIMTRIYYNTFLSGYTVYLTADIYPKSSYWASFFASDTVIAFNNGVNSVDTQSFYDEGFTAGTESVECDPNAGYDNGYNDGVNSVDTQSFYDEGVNSVDTQSFYDEGFIDGVASVVCDPNAGYNEGFTAGVESVVCYWSEQDTIDAYYNGLFNGADFSVNADDYQVGFEAGKNSCGTTGVGMTAFNMGVNVYPNPVNGGTDITIDCPFFESVTVLTIMGQVIESYIIPTVPTSNLTSGMYFLNVKDVDGNVSATKVLVN